MDTRITVAEADFNIAEQYEWLAASAEDGAVVTFVGKVRRCDDEDVQSLVLEHYPQMAEKILLQLVEQARSRWQLNRVSIIHRVGELFVNEQIVFVGVSSAHRANAFLATEFLMDFLKSKAPFWKKEVLKESQNWLDSKITDQNAMLKW